MPLESFFGNFTPFVLMIPLMLLWAGGIYWIIIWNARASKRQFANTAGALGLTVLPKKNFFTPPQAAGNINGRNALLERYTEGSGRSSRIYFRITLKLQKNGTLRFKIEPKSFFGTTIAGLFKKEAVHIDDPAFSELWRVDSNKPDLISAGLTPEILARLTAAHAGKVRGRFELIGSTLTYAEQVNSLSGTVQPAHFLQAGEILSDLAEVADVINA